MENQTPTMTPPPGSPPFPAAIDVQKQVSGPAIGLIVTAIIGIVFQTIMLLINVFSIGMLSKFQEMPPKARKASKCLPGFLPACLQSWASYLP